jgi:hypothetical protein
MSRPHRIDIAPLVVVDPRSAFRRKSDVLYWPRGRFDVPPLILADILATAFGRDKEGAARHYIAAPKQAAERGAGRQSPFIRSFVFIFGRIGADFLPRVDNREK